MIIGIDGHMIGDHSGGNESYYSNILKAMESSAGDTVYLFLKPGVDDTPYKDKFKIVRFQSQGAMKRNFVELPKLAKQYKLDVLHVQYFMPFKWQMSCPVVVTIHDICFEHYKDIFTKKEYIRQKLLIPYAAKHSKYIFTVSNHAKNDIATHYDIDPNKIIVTYNAVNSNFRVLTAEELNEPELRSKFGIGNNDYLLTVGNLQPRKNLPRLIEAFNKWKEESGDPAKLVIVGKKAWMYSGILSSAGVNKENIVLTDYVSDQDLVRLYNAAKAFIYPSFFEGFGIPPLEAMACGTPVAVANATSLPEVVGDAGIYFDPFDVEDIKKVVNLLMSKEEALNPDKMDRNAQLVKFSWKSSATQITATYNKCKR